MKHYGDITKIKGYDVPCVNVVCGGSPCQDLSVAGKRAGLAGERSGLFMEQIRIIKGCVMKAKNSYEVEGQMSIFDIFNLDIWSGRMSPEHSQAEQSAEPISRPSLKKPQKWQKGMPAFLDLRNGHQQDASWEMGGALLGEYTMRSFGEYPSEERESRLSQILEERPH